MDPVYGVVLVLVLSAGLGWVVLEMRLRALRTQVLHTPGGLRFEAHDFSLQVLRKEQELCVQYVRGIWTPPAQGAVQGLAKYGRTECTFSALGFRVDVHESVALQSGQALTVRFGGTLAGVNVADLVVTTSASAAPAKLATVQEGTKL